MTYSIEMFVILGNICCSIQHRCYDVLSQFPVDLEARGAAYILHSNTNRSLDVRLSFCKKHILSSSLRFQNKSHPLTYLCLKTLNKNFTVLMYLAVITVLSDNRMFFTFTTRGSSGSVAAVTFVQKRFLNMYDALKHKALRLHAWEARGFAGVSRQSASMRP